MGDVAPTAIPRPVHNSTPLTIGVIAPASQMRDVSKLEAGIAYLQQQAHRVVLGDALRVGTHPYLAAPDNLRIQDIHSMFCNPEIDVVWCSRGGYGTPRLLSQLDYALLAQHNKPLVGFSDITALQCAMFTQANMVSFSGAMVGVDIRAGMNVETETWMWDALAHDTITLDQNSHPTLTTLREGTFAGRLICGNLCMIASLIGSPYMPDLEGTVLIVEDIGEPVYKIDRYLRQLEISGVASNLGAIVFGTFNGKNIEPESEQHALQELAREFANNAGIPCVWGLPYGHTAHKLTLPFGGYARLQAHSQHDVSLTFRTSAP